MKKKIEFGMSENLQQAVDEEWTSTERSDAAEAALLREFNYHMLRAEEIKKFLEDSGYGFD